MHLDNFQEGAADPHNEGGARWQAPGLGTPVPQEVDAGLHRSEIHSQLADRRTGRGRRRSGGKPFVP